ncbi:ABC transporter ATP-binding protein [Sedimentibacter sp.]|uniref:ABC transporter ATP-binding protein n=1 Tax=Sedimentibacter sp. TaxID=1960295 RepID=UPI0028ADFB7B|nr:ABC transporter ATP-binding protein [Sedimentibacter sp.]
MDILKLDGISKYFSGLKAVDDVSISIKQGEVFSIIGPNGAGKTTLFNMISGHYSPTKGKKYFEGKDITDLRDFEVAEKGITRTFQNIRLFSNLTVIENVLIGLHIKLKSSMLDCILRNNKNIKEENDCYDEAMNLLETIGLKQKAFDLARNLSYGEQRKLEIIRALASKPRLLLLDEPTAGMNNSEAKEVVEFIRELNSTGLTILLIEHNMRVVMGVSNSIAVLDHGIKIAHGSASEIQNNELVIEAYLGRGKKK